VREALEYFYQTKVSIMAFIVFEGGEATGKSTQLQLLLEWLGSLGISCLRTREPGGSPFAEQIRGLFKNVPEHGDAPLPITELLLVMAARSQHVQRTIIPALAQRKWVLCDRFLDSSYIYQGIRGGIPKTVIDSVSKAALSGVFPDLTIVFGVPHEVARERMKVRGNVDVDRLDSEDDAVHRVIADGFERIVSEKMPWADGFVPERVYLDASGDVESIHRAVRALVLEYLGVGK
jgi:dTMP kinase